MVLAALLVVCSLSEVRAVNSYLKKLCASYNWIQSSLCSLDPARISLRFDVWFVNVFFPDQALLDIDGHNRLAMMPLAPLVPPVKCQVFFGYCVRCTPLFRSCSLSLFASWSIQHLALSICRMGLFSFAQSAVGARTLEHLVPSHWLNSTY
jgi:hypothetical protein